MDLNGGKEVASFILRNDEEIGILKRLIFVTSRADKEKNLKVFSLIVLNLDASLKRHNIGYERHDIR